MPNNMYIAVEIMSRELHAKVLLACVAAEQGYNATVGNSDEMRDALRAWKPGVIVWKGLAKKAQKNYRLFHDFGHIVVAQCEEGLAYPSSKFYTKLRVSVEALSELDIFFAWGKKQKQDILSKVPGEEQKITLAGNPRIDLLDEKYRGVFDKEVDNINKTYFPYLLVNTNFSSFTHVIGCDAVIDRLKKKGTIITNEDEKFYRGRAENREKLFYEFIKMLESLTSSFKDYNIILRPHPTESISLWKSKLSHLEKVKVVREGSAIPWIIGSELLIHNDCTTAIEASILGKDVISYRPTANNLYESKFAVAFGVSAETIDALSAAVQDSLDSNKMRVSSISVEDKNLLKNYIHSIDNEPACKVIVHHVDRLIESNKHRRQKSFLVEMKRIIRRYRYGIINFKKSRRKAARAELDRKRGLQSKKRLTVSDVREIIDMLNSNSKLFNDLVVKPVLGTETCIKIFKK